MTTTVKMNSSKAVKYRWHGERLDTAAEMNLALTNEIWKLEPSEAPTYDRSRGQRGSKRRTGGCRRWCAEVGRRNISQLPFGRPSSSVRSRIIPPVISVASPGCVPGSWPRSGSGTSWPRPWRNSSGPRLLLSGKNPFSSASFRSSNKNQVFGFRLTKLQQHQEEQRRVQQQRRRHRRWRRWRRWRCWRRGGRKIFGVIFKKWFMLIWWSVKNFWLYISG